MQASPPKNEEAHVDPPPPVVEEQKFLSAAPVTVKRTPKQTKPTTAKETLRARAAKQAALRGEAKKHRIAETKKNDPTGRDDDEAEERDSTPDSESANRSASESPPRLSFWQRLKRFITG